MPGAAARGANRGATGLEALRRAIAAFEAHNVGLAEALCRRALAEEPRSAPAINLLARVAIRIGEHGRAVRLLHEAVDADPYFKPVRKNLAAAERALGASPGRADGVTGAPGVDAAGRFVVIKAWGCGFWSDVSHVLGALLLAEMTGRTPIVHWGAGSLFRDEGDDEAFSTLFEPPSDARLDDVLGRGLRFFPPKWSERNLREAHVNKFDGEHSRVSGLLLLNREEEVVVSDFHTGVVDLAPWVRPGHGRHGMDVETLLRALIRDYLRPRADVAAEIDAFARERLSPGPVVAAHVRGSDKILEDRTAEVAERMYPPIIARMSRELGGTPPAKVFLLTDSAPVHETWSRTYGERLVAAPCARTATMQGLHYQAHESRRRLAVEVMRDTYLAARCDAFVGLGSSNVSCMVSLLKEWGAGKCELLGPALHMSQNVRVHER